MVQKPDDATLAAASVDEAQVVGYLRQTPDFLFRHPELSLVLAPPSRWPDGDTPDEHRVIDMQVFMIERLREEIDRIKGAAEHLILTSRSNMSTQNRTHKAVLTLLSADSLEMLARTVADDLAHILDVDAAVLALEPGCAAIDELDAPGLSHLPEGWVETTLGGPDRDCALAEAVPGDPVLFNGAATLVASSAMVRLTPGPDLPSGLLALGSRHDSTFHPGQGTELLTFLAHVVESCLCRLLP